MDADLEGALARNSVCLRDMFVAVGEGKAGAHDPFSSSESWLRLVADVRIFCSILPRSASVSD